MKNIQIEYLYTTKGKLYQIRVHHRGRMEVLDGTNENVVCLINAYHQEPTFQSLFIHDHDVLDCNGVIIDVV